MTAQEEKIKALDEFATKLIEGQHYAADDVAQRRAMVIIGLAIRKNSVKILSYFIFFKNLVVGEEISFIREISSSKGNSKRFIPSSAVRTRLRRNKGMD